MKTLASSPQQIELLSPAKNLHCGIAAITHGADAVYIGGPEFGARKSAGNSPGDIEELVTYAHQFSAKVYVALNTVLNDKELKRAVALAHTYHDIGVDALIVQDMGVLESEMPPIPLHASTQANNRTAKKVQFLEEVGFKQVVLARELSFAQIREIREKSSVPLEFFVHGALCVSYSGQCYISEVMTGRSANRGECAQFCRHKYDLKDATGRVLEKDRYLLSLKDLDLSAQLNGLIDAGISSFKIEGRLKDENYVKNVTAFYRKALDTIIENDTNLCRSSSGTCKFSFIPDTSKSFNRGKTEYYLKKKRTRPGAIHSPKSLGQKLGSVTQAKRDYFEIDGTEQVNNGDGLCFFHPQKGLMGIKVNRVDGNKIYPKDPPKVVQGSVVYRNLDTGFTKVLNQSDGCRTLAIDITVIETATGLSLSIKDEDGICSQADISVEKELAKQEGRAAAVAEKQVRKSGNTIFSVQEVVIEVDSKLYLPASTFNELRRQGFENHLSVRLAQYRPQSANIVPNTFPWIRGEVDYLDNITNKKSEDFYLRHGVNRSSISRRDIAKADDDLMRTRYCIKAQLGLCPKSGTEVQKLSEPLSLTDNTGEYALFFECDKCEMVVSKKR